MDFTEVTDQEHAKRAVEIAASGGHDPLFNGPPESGKTMLPGVSPGRRGLFGLAAFLRLFVQSRPMHAQGPAPRSGRRALSDFIAAVG